MHVEEGADVAQFHDLQIAQHLQQQCQEFLLSQLPTEAHPAALAAASHTTQQLTHGVDDNEMHDADVPVCIENISQGEASLDNLRCLALRKFHEASGYICGLYHVTSSWYMPYREILHARITCLSASAPVCPHSMVCRCVMVICMILMYDLTLCRRYACFT